ncbi:MAG: TolC family protein [Gammaproteobacteria bacterium]
MRTKLLVIGIMLCCANLHITEVSAEGLSESHSALSDLVRDAVNSNPGVQSAQAALDAALARERAGKRPLYNPALEVDAEDAIDNAAFAGINQSIDWSDKRGARSRVASYERETATAELHRIRQELAIELLNAVVQYDVNQRLFSLSVEREKLMRQFAALAAKRRELGDLNQVELDLARLALAEAQLQRAQSSFTLADARRALAAVLGEEQPSLSALPGSPPYADVNAPDIEQLLNDLPAIRAQVARIAAASSMVKLRTLQTRPDPTVGVRLGREGPDILAGVTLSIPLFVRNNFKAEVDTANAELMQMELQAQDLYRRARAELKTSLDRYRLANQAWQNWLNMGQLSLGNQITVLERLWRAGELSTTDYLVQLKQTLDTRIAAAELHGRLWQTWFAWLAASGQVDTWLGLSMAP